MSKTYPCPAEVEDDCGYPTCAHAAQCERAAQERLARTVCSPFCSALRENAACKAALQSLSACCYGQNLTQSVAGANALVRAYRESDQKLRGENERLCGIVRKFVEDYLKIPWGNDGDCGVTRLVNALDCDINESLENSQDHTPKVG